MKKNNLIAPMVILAAIILVLGGLTLRQKLITKANSSPIKIGIVTDLTGPATYWGQSTQVGAEMAKAELAKEGYNIELVFEDYQLDPAKAATAGQKLVSADAVDGIYAEFNPAAYAINPIVKDKDILFVYDAAPTSQLEENPNAYKTYLDFEKGCENLAATFKKQGINKMGFLKLGWEPGELCLAGIKKVYSAENLAVESFNFGDLDVKTQVTKIKNSGAEALMNVALESDTMTVFKAMQDLKLEIPYGTVTDGIAANVISTYPEQVNRTTIFGFKDVTSEFSKKIRDYSEKQLQLEQGAALAYLHINDMVRAIANGNKDMSKTRAEMDKSKPNNIIGFKGFDKRIAIFDEEIKSLAK